MKRIPVILLSLLTSICFGQNEDYKFSVDIENDTNTIYGYQMHSWDLSRMGSYDKALIFWDKDHNSNYSLTVQESLEFLKYSPVNAIDYILTKADSFQVIMLNEAHHSNLHRDFTTRLLEDLYQKGFKYLGFEALNVGDTTINDRKLPLQSSGYYTKEPSFGNLIRTALEIGYTIFGYDVSTGGTAKEREIRQAEAIQKIIDREPNAKILIHAGFDHIREDENFGSWEKAMAGRFKEFTGIDPLTIDQVQMSERSAPEYENPVYGITSVVEPTVFINDHGDTYVAAHSGKKFDVRLFHPKTTYRHHRPEWLFTPQKNYYPLASDRTELTLPCLVFAFKKNEFESQNIDDLIPVDIAEINQNNESDIGLLLAKGEYILIFKDRSGLKAEKDIEIK